MSYKGVACVGVDQSITGCGLAIVQNSVVTFAHGWTQVKKQQVAFPEYLSWFKPRSTKDDSCKINRLIQVSDWVLKFIDDLILEGFCVFVAMEGYAFSKKSNRQSDLYELGGLIKGGTWKRGIPFRIYTPQQIKKAWTGSGNADKDQMVKACANTFGLDFTSLKSDGENLADAVCIAQLLDRELLLRAGNVDIIEPNVLQILTKPTKANPISLSEKPFIFYNAENHNKPITIKVERKD